MADSLFTIERGNPDRLEGRVLVYSTIPHLHCEHRHPAVYMGSNPFDVLDRDEVNAIKQAAIEQDIPDLQGFFSQEGNERPGLIIKPVTLTSPKEALRYDGDIINVGNYSRGQFGLITVHSVGIAYMHKYISQWEERMAGNLKTPTKETPRDLTAFGPEQLQSQLYGLVGDLMHGLAHNDNNRAGFARKTLAQFGASSSHRAELERLISIVEGNSPKKLELAQKQVEMIVAIRAERYELASRLRDEIKALV